MAISIKMKKNIKKFATFFLLIIVFIPASFAQASYLFDGTDDTMTGTFTSTYADPVTLAAFIKISVWATGDAALELGNIVNDIKSSYLIRSGAFSDEWSAVSFESSLGIPSDATYTLAIDNTWVGFVGKFSSNTQRDVYLSSLADHTLDTTNRAVGDVLQFIRVGENLAGGGDFTGRIANVAIWNSALSDSDITSYMNGTCPTSIASANLIGYWPLSTNNSTQNNDGLDTGGDLSVTGAVYDSDHPTITGCDTGSIPREIRLFAGFKIKILNTKLKLFAE